MAEEPGYLLSKNHQLCILRQKYNRQRCLVENEKTKIIIVVPVIVRQVNLLQINYD
jgi:hypothetical protein